MHRVHANLTAPSRQYLYSMLLESAKHDKKKFIKFIIKFIKFILHFGTRTENNDGSYFGMDGSALSPSRGQKHTITQ